MSKMSLSQIDERLKQMKVSELLLMNHRGEQHQLDKKSRFHTILLFFGSGFFVLISTIFSFDGSLTDYLRVGLAIITLVVMGWSYFRNGTLAMLGIAFILALNGIYQLIIIGLADGVIQGTSIIIGTVHIGFALYYIQQANHYKDLQAQTDDTVDTSFYDDIYTMLDDSEPDNSNALIELSEMGQSIIVWLRPTVPVILLKGDKRLFFDTTKSFELTINGQDKGGDKVSVRARIIDGFRRCSISRHGWLRYIRYAG